MNTFQKRKGLILLALSVGVIFSLFKEGQFALSLVNAIEVKEMPRSPGNTLVNDTKALSLFWAKAKTDHTVSPLPSANELESLFQREQKKDVTPAIAVNAEPPEPDTKDVLRQRVKVNAIADNGAFLNGHFFQVGTPITAFQIQKKNGSVDVPTLIAITGKYVTLEVNGDTVNLPVSKR